MSLGLTISIIILIMLYALIVKLIGYTVEGWTFIIISIWLLGGLQMFSIGIIMNILVKYIKKQKNVLNT